MRLLAGNSPEKSATRIRQLYRNEKSRYRIDVEAEDFSLTVDSVSLHGRTFAMLYKLHGFAWYAFPDLIGVTTGDAVDPGHPFANGSGGVSASQEVLYFKRFKAEDTGVLNEQRDHAYLVLTRTQLHPKLAKGWESEPAVLSDKFKSQDGRVRMTRIVEKHHRHSGDVVECELRVEHG
jgi:hypothetical protein